MKTRSVALSARTGLLPLPPRPVRCIAARSGASEQPQVAASPVAVAPAVSVTGQLEQTQLAYPAGYPAAPPGVPYNMPLPGQPGVEGTSAVYMSQPGYYQAPRQGQDGQYYYAAPPPGYYAPPAPAYQAQEPTSAVPWWIWLGGGVILANVINKVQEFMKNPKTPQQMMTEMAMKQMMGAMGNQAGAGSPFGKPGAGMPPFPMGGPPFGAPPTPAASGPASATVDVSAGAPSAASSSSSAGDRKGDKFATRVGGADSSAKAPSSASNGTGQAQAAQQASTSSTSAGRSGFMDVVEPVVQEPPSSRGSANSSSFFSDAASTAGGAAGSAAGAGASNGAGAGETGSVMSEMMENMLRNPQMQKMLYPYLPPSMQNPDAIEWMLNNPEVKKQMAQMFESQNAMSPQMMEMMKTMDFNQDKVNQQFQELGLKPEDVITKVMANPELASGFSNPKVQAAIMDISQNPMNIVKYQSDPEVMKVLEQVTTLFQPDMPPNKRG